MHFFKKSFYTTTPHPPPLQLGTKEQVLFRFTAIDDQANTFISSIRVSYVRVNFVGVEGCTFDIRFLRYSLEYLEEYKIICKCSEYRSVEIYFKEVLSRKNVSLVALFSRWCTFF